MQLYGGESDYEAAPSAIAMYECRYYQIIAIVSGAIISALVIISLVQGTRIFAQDAIRVQDDWVPQQRITDHGQAAWPPLLIADNNRTVHAFASYPVGDVDPESAVVYRRWTLEGGWTDAIDILLLPVYTYFNSAYLDEQGMLHVIFYGGYESGNLYYSKAPARVANRAPAWSEPVIIGTSAYSPSYATLAKDGSGVLHAVYSGNGADGLGLYTIYSRDYGETWTEPKPLHIIESPGLFPFDLQQAVVDDTGKVHLVWQVNNPSGNAEAVYYARFENENEEWSKPVILSPTATHAGSMIDYDGELFYIYHDSPTESLARKRHMMRSTDGGDTWTEPVRLFPHEGSNGPASLVIDSANILHMFFGNRVDTGQGIVQGMWHSVWQGDRWSDPKAIVSGKRVVDVEGGAGFDPSFARAVVSQGNVAMVVWMTDPGAGRNGAWYSYSSLDAPELPVEPLPNAATDLAAVTPPLVSNLPEISPAEPASTTARREFSDTPANARNGSSTPPIIFGVVPVAVLLLAVLVVRHSRW